MIRNSNGDFIGGMAIPLGNQTNHVVEASAALYGLIYAKYLNLKNIWIEGDSLNIINCLNKINPPLWTISNIISKAIYIINSFNNCIISHNYREANGLADWASKVACLNDHNIIWESYDTLPPKVHDHINHDKWRSWQKSFNYEDVSELRV